MIYDFIIIGGGPAGAVAAFCLQKQGARCLILEARKYVDEKICGGLLTFKGLELLQTIGMNPNELFSLGANRIDSIIHTYKDEKAVHRYHCGEYGMGLHRLCLDQWLLEQAISIGVDLRFGERVTDYFRDIEGFLVNGYIGRQLIFATGARGFTTKSQQGWPNGQSLGISTHLRVETDLKNNTVYFWFFNEKEPDYCWAIPIGGNIWNIGIWFQQIPENPLKIFTEKKSQLIDCHFSSQQTVIKPRGGFCGNVNLSQELDEDCFGIGDFAGTNNIETGEGLRFAIQSAIQVACKLGNQL